MEDQGTKPGTDVATRETETDIDLTHLGMGHIMTLAEAFHESGIFSDVESKAQAMVKVIAGQEMGFPPIYSMQNFHLISVADRTTGKKKTTLAMAAEAMGLLLQRSGRYDYRIVEHDDDKCSIQFMKLVNGGWEEVYLSTFTTQDAVRAGIWRAGGSWEKFPQAMNFSRAMSQGCRRVAPEVMGGPKYTVEEAETLTPELLAEDQGPPEPDKPRRPKRRPEPTPRAEKSQDKRSQAVKATTAVVAVDKAKDTDDSPPVPPETAETEGKPPPEAPAAAPAKPAPAQSQRDHKTVRSLQDLYRACQDDFGLMPDKVMKELGVKSNMEIVRPPWDCYLQIAAVYALKQPAGEVVNPGPAATETA